ncbi:MAG: hypothetical protein HRT44_01605, partial [Bdellovibrionales bacterium]|nr:hypothetical protein [Bdellovibrionales bacterium]NQZ17941.1 hypothetical protein [Bdellovibrionales bacterium]
MRLHHDVEILPSGNLLVIAWELKNQAECYAAGRDPGTLVGNQFTADPLPGGSTYNFQVDDGSGCPPVILTPVEYCNCTPDIKPSISVEQEISCFGETDGQISV